METDDMRSTTNLLAAGIIAGPFFFILSILHAFLREGFDLVKHPASLLSLGDAGWIQVLIFVLTGLMFIACAVGLRRVLVSGIGSTWVSRLFAAFGFAMIIGGIFVADPGLGFPPGAPEGVPAEMSWHATVHGFAPILGFLSLVVALCILARRFGSRQQPVWMWMTLLVSVATVFLTALPNVTADWERGIFNFLPLWAGVTLSYAFTSFVIAKLKREAVVTERGP